MRFEISIHPHWFLWLPRFYRFNGVFKDLYVWHFIWLGIKVTKMKEWL